MLITDILARNVARRGTYPFVRHADCEVTYGTFERLSNQVANAFLTLGVEVGDRITVALGNSLEYLVAAFGAMKAGAVLHPLEPTLAAGQLGHILADADPALIVTTGAYLERLRGAITGLNLRASTVTFDEAASAAAAIAAGPPRRTPSSDTVPPGKNEPKKPAGDVVSLDELITGSPTSRPRVPVAADRPALLLYTAGTTRTPRGALFTHTSTGLGGLRLVEALGITCDDSLLTVAPLSSGLGWLAIETALHAATTIAFPGTLQPSRFWPLAHATGATVLFADRTALAQLLLRKPSPRERQSALRLVMGPGIGGLRDEILERFGVDRVADCFWSTESGVIAVEPTEEASRPGSAGPPLPDVQVRILDGDGQIRPAGQIGEIAVRSPRCLASYFQDADETAVAFRDGWFLTGDLGWLDESGWLYFVDRTVDVVHRGAELVSSLRVEQALAAHPRVAEVAVVGIADAQAGREIKAVVVPKGAVSEDELRAFAAERLTDSHVPRIWEFRSALPRTPTHAVEKYKLRDEESPPPRPTPKRMA
jgi:acyl-CoA synthetase (AMP-forming)/AMP-acid ligase II